MANTKDCPVCGKVLDLDNEPETNDHMKKDKRHKDYIEKARLKIIANQIRQSTGGILR